MFLEEHTINADRNVRLPRFPVNVNKFIARVSTALQSGLLRDRRGDTFTELLPFY